MRYIKTTSFYNAFYVLTLLSIPPPPFTSSKGPDNKDLHRVNVLDEADELKMIG